jgi:hypothetical protein
MVDNGGLVARLAPSAVQVFNAQQQASAERSGKPLVAKRRIGVSEVQPDLWADARTAGRAKAQQRGSA